jgi:hypothetical protein
MIRCVNFCPYQKNTLCGFADELTRVGLVLHDCTWHWYANGKEWISFPARSREDPNGGVSWSPVVEFAAGAKKMRAEFQRQALEAAHAAAEANNAI